MQLPSFLCIGFYMWYLFCIRQGGKYTDKGKDLKTEQGNWIVTSSGVDEGIVNNLSTVNFS